MVDEDAEQEDDEILLDVDEEEDGLYNEDSQNSKPSDISTNIILEKIDT